MTSCANVDSAMRVLLAAGLLLVVIGIVIAIEVAAYIVTTRSTEERDDAA